MYRIPYDTIINKIKQQTNLSDTDINLKISQKLTQLSGLISREGAAHILANELGVKLYEQTEGLLKIRNILLGMRAVETAGRVIKKFDLVEFDKDNRKGKVASLHLADETGQIRLVLWNEQAENLEKINLYDVVKVKGAYVRENKGIMEIHLGDRGFLEINPSDVLIKDIVEKQEIQIKRKRLYEIKENDTNIEVLATIVQAFMPTFFEICPECQKRVRPKEDKKICDTHGQVIPNYSFVLNVILDDGTDAVRTVFFRQQAEHLTKKSAEQILEIRNIPLLFEELKKQLLGTQIKIVGRVIKNSVINRLEIIANTVDPDPDPEKEIEHLEKELSQPNLTPEELAEKIVNNEI